MLVELMLCPWTFTGGAFGSKKNKMHHFNSKDLNRFNFQPAVLNTEWLE